MAEKRSFREKLGLARRLLTGREHEVGFFINYPYAMPAPGQISPYPAIQELLDARRTKFREQLSNFSSFLPDLQKGIEDGGIPWAENGMFPKLDVMATYCMIRSGRPSRILEIGSGTSSHVMARAISDNGSGKLTCIDPAPRREIEMLDIFFEKRLLQENDAAMLKNFESGDVLFIDSSHFMFPGFDTDIEFNRLFPELPSGALVHVHDIFLPENYPDRWSGRYYAEQNALIGWIVSGYFEIVYPGFFMASQMKSDLGNLVGDMMPVSEQKYAGSIWLRKS